MIGSYSRDTVFSSVGPPELMGLWGITQTKFTEAMTSAEKSTLRKYLLLPLYLIAEIQQAYKQPRSLREVPLVKHQKCSLGFKNVFVPQ